MIIFFKMYTQAVLIREYHQVKKNNNRSGTGRSKFALFDLIDGVLQDRLSTSPAFLLQFLNALLDKLVSNLAIEGPDKFALLKEHFNNNSIDNYYGKEFIPKTTWMVRTNL